MKPPNNPYTERTIQWLNAYEKDLWSNLERVPQLKPEVGEAILGRFLEQACQCQNIGNIEIGRYGILVIPREWVLQHIGRLAEPLLQLEDEWEYRRLFEVYSILDKLLAKELALRALNNPNPDIKEAGQDFLEKLNCDAA